MKVVIPIVTMAVAAGVTSTLLLATSTPEDVAIKPSPGVTAEQLLQVQKAGNTTEFLPEVGVGNAAGRPLRKKPRHTYGGTRKVSYTPEVGVGSAAGIGLDPEVGVGSAAGIGLDKVVTIQWVGSTEEYPEMIGRGAGKKIKKSVRAGGRGPRQPNHNR